MSRLAVLESQVFDVAVIGGGIIGAGIARDAARRGLAVALVEQHDFGSGTTAGSTRLIHGGLRYLEMLDFPLVRLDLRERETLLRIAPHLVAPLEFVLPFYRQSSLSRTKLHAGMWLYDALSFDKSLPRHRALGQRELLALEPSLAEDGLHGGTCYYDAQVAMPERLCLENVLDARAAGAIVVNYARATALSRSDAGTTGMLVADALSGHRQTEVRARVVVNASGAWLDRVNGRLVGQSQPRLRTTKGIHVTCPPTVSRAVALQSAVDGRLVFVIPWLGYSWIGTTDTDFSDDPAAVRATGQDVDYLMASVSPYVPALANANVLFTNAGVRALVRKRGNASSVTRSHTLVDHDREGTSNLISVVGGKITGYRAIAEEVTDRVCRRLGVSRPCVTASQCLPGARGLPGTQEIAGSVDEQAPLETRVRHAIRHELCLRVSDFLLRRTTFGFGPDQGQAVLPQVAALMASELGWSAERRDADVAEYERHVAETQRFRSERGATARVAAGALGDTVKDSGP